ncbi:MAG: ferrous iron transport protein A [bacterium]|nr:ferrous iron transport protein A [bacterium]
MTPLDKMLPGQKGKVVGFSDDNRVSRRLMEMGMLPGSSIEYIRNAPLHDPMEVQVGECCLSLRHAEASLVHIEVDEA